MKIIPAIDIIDGKCVRLTKGDYNRQTTYNDDPVEIAKAFEDAGIEYLHVVDLDGAKSNRIINASTLERIAKKTNLKIDFGGGLKSDKDLQLAFNSGASQVTIGSIAVQNRIQFLKWTKKYGADKIILGADCNNRFVATNGWLTNSNLEILDFIQSYQEEGIKQTVVTDISKDGMLQGPSFDLYAEILKQTTIKLIASGGITSVADLKQLKEIGCDGAIIGKAIYEGRITLKEISTLC